jgi:hypothetical protein
MAGHVSNYGAADELYLGNAAGGLTWQTTPPRLTFSSPHPPISCAQSSISCAVEVVARFRIFSTNGSRGFLGMMCPAAVAGCAWRVSSRLAWDRPTAVLHFSVEPESRSAQNACRWQDFCGPHQPSLQYQQMADGSDSRRTEFGARSYDLR